MVGRIGSSEIEPHMPAMHAGGSARAPEGEIENFNHSLHDAPPRPTSSVYSQEPGMHEPEAFEMAPRPTSSVYSQESGMHLPSLPSEHAPSVHGSHAEPHDVVEEPAAKKPKSKSDQAKDFGDKFDKILKPLSVPLGISAQIASLVTFGQAQEAKKNDSSSDSSAQGTNTNGQSSDPAPIPSQPNS